MLDANVGKWNCQPFLVPELRKTFQLSPTSMTSALWRKNISSGSRVLYCQTEKWDLAFPLIFMRLVKCDRMPSDVKVWTTKSSWKCCSKWIRKQMQRNWTIESRRVGNYGNEREESSGAPAPVHDDHKWKRIIWNNRLLNSNEIRRKLFESASHLWTLPVQTSTAASSNHNNFPF